MMVRLLTLCIVGLLAACTGPHARAPAYSSTPARLVLKINPELGSASDKKYEIKLTNIYDRPLWINGRLFLAPLVYSPLTLDIQGPSGAVAYNCKADIRHASSKEYTTLKPADSLSYTGALDCLTLKAGETYTVRARYHDRNPDAPLAPPSAVHLSTEIVSEPVQFKVVECTAEYADAGWCDPNKPIKRMNGEDR